MTVTVLYPNPYYHEVCKRDCIELVKGTALNLLKGLHQTC